ncbi:LacI family DNA-binding transcriptional regulator [Oryzobacter terrae]|uniref:LacI family DNA-binding transcriptional regulator n=1 Tax=Oryzobacter terrae TaxID=1620385 RepID=UPI00366E14A8
MTSERPSPTMADVARRAGVSHQTVSRVLNAPQTVSAATRLRVNQAVSDLGYRRNSVARALASGHTRVIGVVVDELAFHGPASTVVAVAEAARQAGYVISLDPQDTMSTDNVSAALERHVDRAVEAVVVVSAHGWAGIDSSVADVAIPVVSVDGALGGATASVGVDQRAGATIATRHLVELGHRHIAHVAGPADWPQAVERRAAFLAALQAHGLGPGPVLDGDWSARSGHQAMHRLLGQHPELTAVVVANDQMAVGAYRAIAQSGRRVPDDISVVGFDNIPEAGFLSPPLTTVQQDFSALGREAVRLVLAALAGEPCPSRLIPPRLVVRSSTAPPGEGQTPTR